MKIIIVGGGETGATLTRNLTEEGHDVTIVDQNADQVTGICDSNDVMGLIGNGMNYSALSEAGIDRADLLIAVTGSDEQNLLCCLFARKSTKCATIARIRNPIFLEETEFIKEQVGLSLVINPELEAADTISRLLRFPHAIEINSFAKGKAEMITFRIPEGSMLEGKSMTQIRSKIHTPVLFCSVKRGGEWHFPDGSFELRADDKATVILQPRDALKFFRQIKLETHSVKSAMIVGGGTISYYLAKQLQDTNISVKIIEPNEAVCHELAEKLPHALIIHGDPSDKDLLLEEGIDTTDAFVALTPYDEENVILSLYAKEVGKAKVITKVDRFIFNELITNLNLDSVIYPQKLTADEILQYVRAKQNAMGNNIETLYKLVENKVEALEFNISANAPGLGIPLRELSLKENLLICGIHRKQRFILPGGDTTIQPGDQVIVVTGQKKLNDFKDILK
ncbi:MAG: Trk system potassium transporter TrkA [Clostridia bacterium]|nr:Trk system potassium transporter TrkA [Clostridia bacterium]